MTAITTNHQLNYMGPSTKLKHFSKVIFGHFSHTKVLINLVTKLKGEIPRSVKWKNKEKYAAKKNNHTRQYLHSSAIYLRLQSSKNFTILKKKYKMQQYNFHSKKQHKTLISKTIVFLSCAQYYFRSGHNPDQT